MAAKQQWRKRQTLIVSATAALVAAGMTTVALQVNTEAKVTRDQQPAAAAPATIPSAPAPAQAPAAATPPAPAEPGAEDSGAATLPPAAPVPDPAQLGATAGMSDESLAEVKQAVIFAAGLDAPVVADSGVEAHLGQLEAVDGVAAGIGEVAGPAVRFTVTLVNRGGHDLPTRNTVVTANVGPDEIPALQLSGPGASNLPPMIPSGQEASGTYVFLAPPELRDQIRIFVNYQASSPIAAFEGTAPGVKNQ